MEPAQLWEVCRGRILRHMLFYQTECAATRTKRILEICVLDIPGICNHAWKFPETDYYNSNYKISCLINLNALKIETVVYKDKITSICDELI